MQTKLAVFSLAAMALAAFDATQAQQRPEPAALISAQRQAMQPLAFMNGIWRGPAWTILPSGEKHAVTQTERIGPFLDGTVKVIKGRGYDAEGKLSFNAFGTARKSAT